MHQVEHHLQFEIQDIALQQERSQTCRALFELGSKLAKSRLVSLAEQHNLVHIGVAGRLIHKIFQLCKASVASAVLYTQNLHVRILCKHIYNNICIYKHVSFIYNVFFFMNQEQETQRNIFLDLVKLNKIQILITLFRLNFTCKIKQKSIINIKLCQPSEKIQF